MSVVMYGVPTQPTPYEPLDPNEWKRRADELRRTTPSFSITTNPVTKTDLDAAVTRIETQMLALLKEVQKATAYATEAERLRWTEELAKHGVHVRDHERPEHAVARFAKRLQRRARK